MRTKPKESLRSLRSQRQIFRNDRRNMKFARSLTIFALTIFAAHSFTRAQPKLDLVDGDRIVFVGSTLIEREQQAGYIETMLVSRFPGKHLMFRNVGYSGDTVSGEALGLCTGWSTFESPEQRL